MPDIYDYHEHDDHVYRAGGFAHVHDRHPYHHHDRPGCIVYHAGVIAGDDGLNVYDVGGGGATPRTDRSAWERDDSDLDRLIGFAGYDTRFS